jgi:hypothetical protein
MPICLPHGTVVTVAHGLDRAKHGQITVMNGKYTTLVKIKLKVKTPGILPLATALSVQNMVKLPFCTIKIPHI